MPILSRISVTPIKGTALHHPREANLTPTGIPGDRRFHLVDERGLLFTSFAFGRLLQVRCDYDLIEERLRCTFPDGRVAEGSALAAGEGATTDFWGRPVPGAEVGGPFAGAFSAFVGEHVRLLRADREGDGPDVHRLSVVSLASVGDLARRGRAAHAADAARFRMNLELGDCAPYEEDTWDGRRVRVGDAIVRLCGKIPRCRVTTLDPMTGEKDFDALRIIAAYRPLGDSP